MDDVKEAREFVKAAAAALDQAEALLQGYDVSKAGDARQARLDCERLARWLGQGAEAKAA